MSLIDFMTSGNTQKQDNKVQTPSEDIKKIYTDEEYFDMIDPETGLKYNIPMLNPSNPGYYYKYIYYMKIKERNMDTFKKIMEWD